MSTTAGPAPSAVTQNVTAVEGFAYGAVGADIHVFGDGSPLYLLENHRRPPKPDPAWLRELPSRLLNAGSQVVPFTGRRHERDDLCAWCEYGPRLAVRWLHAPGGQGKSRLADRVAADVAEQGWKVVVASQGVGAVRPSPGSQDLRLAGHRGVLLIVDYSDRWTVTALTWLLRNALLHQPDVRARVLLLARTTTGWPPVRAVLQDPHVQAGTSEQPLPPLTADDDNARQTMFAVARDSFAAVYGLPNSTAITSPAGLAGPEFGLTLTVHVAALVAVDAYATGTPAPPGPEHLTSYLLDREQQHWARLYEGRSRGLDHHTPPSVMARTAFTAALTGPLPHPEAVRLLTGWEQELPAERILTDHTRCYPSADPARDTVFEPLHPDRLAEDYLALTLSGTGNPGAPPGHAWATTRLHQILQQPATTPDDPAYLSRAVTFLIAAAARRPRLGPTHLYPLLRARPHLALTAGGAALATLAAIPDVDLDVLEAIESLLPAHRHVDLDVVAAAITRRLTDYRLETSANAATRADLFTNLGWRLTNAGQHEEALTATLDAVAIRRRLAEADPVAHLPDLAIALTNLGARLSEVGSREEALDATVEAVAIFGRLHATNPAGHEREEARAFAKLGETLAQQGQPEEALKATMLAVVIFQELAESNPAAHEPDLAIALTSLGETLAKQGQLENALNATVTAVEIYTRLFASNPAAHEPDLAIALTNLGETLAKQGQPEEALKATVVAAEIFQRLAESNPAAHEPHLAIALTNLGETLAKQGQPEEALTVTVVAVDISRRLAEVNPDANLPDLAMALTNLGMLLSNRGQPKHALAAHTEAVQICRRLAESNPAGHEPHLAIALTNVGEMLAKHGQLENAMAAAQGAVEIFQRLAESNPAAYEADLAAALRHLGNPYGGGRSADVEALYRQKLALEEELVRWEPDNADYRRDLCDTYSRLADHLVLAGGWSADAEELYRQALAIREELVRLEPESTDHRRNLSVSYERLADLAGENGDDASASRWVDQALGIRRELHRREVHRPDLAEELAYVLYLAARHDVVPLTDAEAEVVAALAPFASEGQLTDRADALLDWARS